MAGLQNIKLMLVSPHPPTYPGASLMPPQWIFPSLGALLLATGIMIGFNALITYIVDAYPTYSASAVAASSVLRCLAAFVFPLFAPTMYEKLGYGWGNSLLGFVAIGIGGPAPILLVGFVLLYF